MAGLEIVAHSAAPALARSRGGVTLPLIQKGLAHAGTDTVRSRHETRRGGGKFLNTLVE